MSESDFAAEAAEAEAADAAEAADPSVTDDRAADESDDVAASDAPEDEAPAESAEADEAAEAAGEDFGTDVSQVGGVGHSTETSPEFLVEDEDEEEVVEEA